MLPEDDGGRRPLFEINKKSVKPYYEQMADLIEQRIVIGELKVGDQLPSEKAMEDLYDVSKSTVRSAMALLRERGTIETRHGKGSSVKRRPQKR